MPYRKKLIEVALPLEAINEASAREKSIRHGHPSTLHLWWARRPLAACRAVIFASLVDDPDDPAAPAAFVEACRALPLGKNAAAEDTPRQRLFDFIERLVLWESTTDEQVLETARELIRLATDGNPPPLLDPFAGGGSIPLEAQRLGLEAHASDLNPVAVMINKALIEIPPMFAGQPPVNPASRGQGTGERGQGTGNRGEGRGKGRQAVTYAMSPIPYKGAAGLAADVRYYGEWMRERAWERIGHLYPQGPNGETVIAWLWARTVKCPNPACGAQMPLVTSFELSKKAGLQAWVEPIVDRQAKVVRFAVKTGKGKAPDPPKIGRGAHFRCLVCGEVAPDQHLKDEGMAGRMDAQLMAIVTEGKNGRSYYGPTPEHEATARAAHPSWRPAGELANDARAIWCKLYGLVDFADLFTPRQLVALTTFSDLVGEARERIRQDAIAAGLPDDAVADDGTADGGTADGARPLRDGGRGARAYAEAVSVYLAFAISKGANLWSSIVSWMSDRGALRETFARQAIPMVWDYAEANPFSASGGSFLMYLDRISAAVGLVPADTLGHVIQADASMHPGLSGCALSTDPPYYDNIGYADLSDFFYVWLRRSLQTIWPSAFSTLLVPKERELIASPYRFGGDRVAAQNHFETGLFHTFSGLGTAAGGRYPATIYYAFKQSDVGQEDGASSTGWETMLEGLVTSGFSVRATWPVRTEGPGRLLSLGTNALASSIVLVCRPRPDDAPLTSRRDFVAALRRELPPALRQMQSGNIAPVDLAQASIGPGMAVYSRYSKVLEPNGQPLTVRTALQLINQALDEYLAELEGDLDEASRFAVAWFEQYGFRDAEFGVADVLARAKNTSVETMAHAGFVSAAGGKVRLVPWQDLDPGRLPEGDVHVSVWEAVHYLVERFDSHGEEGAARLMARMPADLAAAARQLAYRLYSIAERKGWADHARDYNGLVVSWGASQQQAQGYRENYQQGRLF